MNYTEIQKLLDCAIMNFSVSLMTSFFVLFYKIERNFGHFSFKLFRSSNDSTKKLNLN